MANFKGLYVEPRVEARILAFLNLAETASDISDSDIIVDDPDSGGAGSTIGEVVAERILQVRGEAQFDRFLQLEDLEKVEGLGEDKMKDLVHSFSEKAAEAFRKELYDGILAENWELIEDTVVFDSEEAFDAIANNYSSFKDWVAERKYGESHFSPPPEAILLQKSFLEIYDIEHYGAIAFAFYFYQFDADNWFTFDEIRDACESYLSFYPSGYRLPNDILELRILKGFDDFGLTATSTTQGTMPVVVNYPERSITIWQAILND